MAEITNNRHSKILIYKRIVRCTDLRCVCRAILGRQARTRIEEWRQRMHVHHARHRIATIERTLRTTQKFDTTQIQHIEIERVLVQHRRIVDIKSNRRLVDSCAHTAHIDRRGHTRPIIGNIEVGSIARHRAHIINSLALSVIHIDYGLCNRMIHKTLLLDLRRNRHLGHIVHRQRIDALRRRHRKEQKCKYRKCCSH